MKIDFSVLTLSRTLTFCVAMLAAGLACSQTRQALIIGISQYSEIVKAPPLAGVRHDMDSAKRIAAAMGIGNDQIIYLRDQQATKAAILSELKKLGESSSESSRAFVYFSGHGTRYLDESVGGCVEGLLTFDGQTVTHAEFAQATQTLTKKADKVITLMDACHSGGVSNSEQRTRSLSLNRLSPKFHLKVGANSDQCAVPSNMRTRGLLNEVTRLGALQENFVQITSSLPEEVSFDEAGKGGLATQGLRDCLLGEAKDLDASGAVSLEEIRQCAQNFVDKRLVNAIGLLPHHITLRGNRNLIPVALTNPAAQAPVSSPNSTTAAMSPSIPVTAATETGSVPVAVSTPASSTQAPSPPAVLVPPSQTQVVNASSHPDSTLNSVVPPSDAVPPASTGSSSYQTVPAMPSQSVTLGNTVPDSSVITQVLPPAANTAPEVASVATLRDIYEQRDPRRKVEVILSKSVLKIGKDPLELRLKSNRSGYVYLVLLGSDAKSFYILFPNGLDDKHRITAGQTLVLPRSQWQVQAAGPAGKDRLLVLVTDSPRSLKELPLTPSNAQNPFTYTLNDLTGRAALIQFLINEREKRKPAPYGAAWVEVEEVN